MMEQTDWNSYYNKPFKSALITRRYTTKVLVGFIRKYVSQVGFSICEIGGANSCFYEDIENACSPNKYVIVDNNQLGLDKFSDRVPLTDRIILRNEDITDPKAKETCDLVFSVGLIEHFDVKGTKEVIENHFKYLSRPGILIISFPTPTWLYRLTRGCAEMLSLWKFPDERPLTIPEVESALQGKGEIVAKKILWPIFLTQCMMVIRVN